MQTTLCPINEQTLAQAAQLLQAGEVVGFPTETVYGLAADALSTAAVLKIFAAKGRPADNPLIAHVCSWPMAESLATFTPLARQLAAAFWPGPLTLVLAKQPPVPEVVTAGLSTVALRWPAHPAALRLIELTGRPLAAPSANRSGRPSPTLASHVWEDLAGEIPLILDGGAVQIGLESTVVDATGEFPLLLRPGKISPEQLQQLCGKCLLPTQTAAEKPASPGMKYRHYAPQGELHLVADWRAAEALRLSLLADTAKPPLLLLPDAAAAELVRRGVPEAEIIRLGSNDTQLAARLFAALREADQRQAEQIICLAVAESGLGHAIMNRLSKAASKV